MENLNFEKFFGLVSTRMGYIPGPGLYSPTLPAIGCYNLLREIDVQYFVWFAVPFKERETYK